MPTASLNYHVIDGSRILVDVIIGDGQLGGTVVFLGSDEVCAGGEELRECELGDGAALRGRIMVVSTTVVDIQPQTDRTSVNVELRGGHPDPMPVVQAASSKPNGTVNFLTVVQFI